MKRVKHNSFIVGLSLSFGLALFIAAAAPWSSFAPESQASAQAAHRVYLPALARDEGAFPQPTPTPIATATPTRTATPTSTATAVPSLPTATPSAAPGGSARALVRTWYDHVGTTLYGEYWDILQRQSRGEITRQQAANELFIFKEKADSYMQFLDGQEHLLLNANFACQAARQELALASGWLGLMAGWGGLIHGGGDYFAEQEEARNNYFAFMSSANASSLDCSGSVPGSPSPAPTATRTAPGSNPTATPTPRPPTATPTRTPTPSGGGGSMCYASRTTTDWRLEVRPSLLGWDLFEVKVTALTNAATNSSFRVRVTDPNFFTHDSSTKWPFFIGDSYTLTFGSDFLTFGPYRSGTYQVELRVDFLREASVTVFCP